jgi:serine-type D-Ala-D-Ala carboxypeptidase/endopeptidase (penicillin-binding protein 4)
MRQTRTWLWIVWGALLATSASAQSPVALPKPRLQNRIAAVVAKYEKDSKGIVGVSVRDCRTHTELASVRGDELFVPASNQKLLTSAFALASLGGDFNFETRVYARGDEVVVVGDFDPTLGDPVIAEATGRGIYADLDEWALAAAKRYLAKPVKTVVLVRRDLERPGRHPDWPKNQYAAWYAAPAGEMNFANNCIGATFRITAGKPVPILQPSSRFIQVFNKLKAGQKHRWSLLATKDMTDVVLRGTIKTATTEPLQTSIHDPFLLLGRVLGDRLVRAGLQFEGAFRVEDAASFDPSKATLLTQTQRPLQAALWRMNKHSLNMAAECVMLRAGDGTWDGSAKQMAETLVKAYGIGPESLEVRDGSGLSAKNRVAPSALTEVLTRVTERDDWGKLVNSLPVAGVEGKMANRLTDEPYRGRVLAKTGYVYGAQCLSGYILTQDNQLAMAYSVLVNRVPGGQGSKAKAVHEAVCRLLVDAVDGRIKP